MKKVLLFSLIALGLSLPAAAQITCTAISFDADLSASIDTTVSFQSRRNGDCCSGNNCIRFNLKLNPACSYVNFTVASPAPPGNAAFYQIDCGPPTSLGTPICVVGKTDAVITFCKPGNDNPIYTITAAGALKASDDITVREGCTGKIGIAGLLLNTITWTSINPGASGAYNSFLSCTTGCDTVLVTPLPGSPLFIDYKVSGYRLCGPLVSDTIRVFTRPQISVAMNPGTAAVCAGGGSTVTLTATPSGGDLPYNLVWNNGVNGNSITVNTGGTYTVSVTDAQNCLPAVNSVVVQTTPLPLPPTAGSNSPVCEGGSLTLTASSVPGASYYWTGPNGFSSTLQNPVINQVTGNEAGSYSVTVVVGQCSSLPATTLVTVNPIPALPSLSSNSPVCEGSLLSLSASNIAGALYSWNGPSGFVSAQQNPSISSASLLASGSYALKVTVKGCTSAPDSTTVNINALPQAPAISTNSPLCAGNTLSLNAATISGASYSWMGPAGFNSSDQNPVLPNAAVNATGVYSVKATVNGCTGSASTTTVSVNPIPQPAVLTSNSPVCEGNSLIFNASSIAAASYSWTGPNGFSSTQQNPVLSNAALAVSGLYSATVSVNGCSSTASSLNVVVNPVPSLPLVPSNRNLCEGGNLSLTSSSTPGASYSWNGPDGFASTLQNPVISNALPQQSGTYSVKAILNGCSSAAASFPVTVTAIPVAPAAWTNSTICSGKDIFLKAADLTGASYQWTGPNGFSSAAQNPVIPNAAVLHSGTYSLSVTVNGCASSSASSASVTVNQTPEPPVLQNPGPVCEGSNLKLTASSLSGSSFQWTGPDGFTSAQPLVTFSSINAGQAGIYSATATLSGCTSTPAQTTVLVDKAAVAVAGNDIEACSSVSLINLHGMISGGSSTGVWSSGGSGSFAPAATRLNAAYYPSATDKATGFVQLQLQSTNNNSCTAAVSSLTLRFTAPPRAEAGKEQVVCADDTKVKLEGSISGATGFIWTTSGTGSFSPSPLVLNPDYLPGKEDKNAGKVVLKLSTTGSDPCPATEDVTAVIIRTPPAINAESTTYILENSSVVLHAVEKAENTSYQWSPGLYLDKDTIAQPLCTPKESIQYKVSVRDAFGCTADGYIWIKLLRQPLIPNVFTPNGDGINDRWVIKNLPDYSDCTIDIFNRYGQVVYRSTGYNREWDGASNGKPLPAGTYYYVIDQKKGLKPLSGFVDIVR